MHNSSKSPLLLISALALRQRNVGKQLTISKSNLQNCIPYSGTMLGNIEKRMKLGERRAVADSTKGVLRIITCYKRMIIYINGLVF